MKLLIPIDGSECATKTLEWAAETFDRHRAEYYLLFVIPIISDLNTVDYEILDATTILKKARQTLEKAGCKVVATDYALGDAVAQICRFAEEQNVDQVVIGSHGRSGLNKLLMGSTSIAVLEHCKREVTLHRNVARPAAKPMREASRPHAHAHLQMDKVVF